MEPLQEEKSPTNRENGSGAKVGFFGKESLNNIDSGQVEVNSKLYWALKLASFGFPILLLNPGSKEPLSGHSWTQSMTTDEATIREWLTDSPDLNYGVCGGPSGVILDIDVKDDKAGDNALSEIEKDQDLDDCISTSGLIVTTPSGGKHYYLTTPFPVSDSHRFPKGIDVRGAGYTVGPFCQLIAELCKGRDVPGFYVVQNDEAPLEAPLWVLERLKQQGERDPLKDDAPVGELDTPDAVQRAIAFLKVCEPTGTYRTACSIMDFGISNSKALELIMAHWNERRAQPRTEQEIIDRINHAAKYRQEPIGSRSAPLMDLLDKQDSKESKSAVADTDKTEHRLDSIFCRGAAALTHGARREMIIPGWLHSYGVTALLAERGTGKSTLMIDLGLCMALDMKWHNGWPVDRGWTVIYCCGEDEDGAKKNMQAWCVAHDAEMPDRFISMFGVPMLLKREDIEDWVKFLKGKVNASPCCLLIDTWQRATAGASQSDDAQMQVAIQQAELLAQSLNGPVIVAAHPPKHDKMTVMGSTVIENATSAIWHLSQASKGSPRRLETTRIRGCSDGRFHTLKFDEVLFKEQDRFGRQIKGIVPHAIGGMLPDGAISESVELVADEDRQRAKLGIAVMNVFKQDGAPGIMGLGQLASQLSDFGTQRWVMSLLKAKFFNNPFDCLETGMRFHVKYIEAKNRYECSVWQSSAANC